MLGVETFSLLWGLLLLLLYFVSPFYFVLKFGIWYPFIILSILFLMTIAGFWLQGRHE